MASSTIPTVRIQNKQPSVGTCGRTRLRRTFDRYTFLLPSLTTTIKCPKKILITAKVSSNAIMLRDLVRPRQQPRHIIRTWCVLDILFILELTVKRGKRFNEKTTYKNGHSKKETGDGEINRERATSHATEKAHFFFL